MSVQKIYSIWTRAIEPSNLVGRPRTIASIQAAMRRFYQVDACVLSSFVEQKSVWRMLEVLGLAVTELLHGRLPALQCLLFADRRAADRISREIEDSGAETIYFDGIRTYYLARLLRKRFVKKRFVVDFDDLISRRTEQLCASDSKLSLGYLRGRVPEVINRLLAKDAFSKLVARYEARAIQRAELHYGSIADVIVLVSKVEGELLRHRTLARVEVLPPPVDISAETQTYEHFERFVFIGSDALPQNASSIEWIMSHWKQAHPHAEVHIYGKMVHAHEAVAGVHFRGFAQSLSDVYTPGSVLLVPGVLRGGVKTKVFEAFAHGCAVVGNEVSFEGMDLGDYPLCLEDLRLREQIGTIEKDLTRLRQAARYGHQYVRETLDRSQYEIAWRDLLCNCRGGKLGTEVGQDKGVVVNV